MNSIQADRSRDPFQLTPEQLFALASTKIVQRGLTYAKAGRVVDLVEDGRRIEARIQGSQKEPYLVTLEHDGEEILPACTCPFDWEPFCKHAIAALAIRSFGAPKALPGEAEPAARTLEMEELEVRRQRAEKQGFRVRRIDGNGRDGFYGSFEVCSPSGKKYAVQVRSLRERLNHCSCPDHATSMLGTCKHIEAVLTALRKRSPRRFDQAASQPPTVAQVLAERADHPNIRLVLPAQPSPALQNLARTFFDPTGVFRLDPVVDFPRFVEEARRLRSLVIYPDALEHSRALAEERQALQRREEVYRAVLQAESRIPGVNAKLYPYQVEGAAFLASRGRALLGDDMGLGKTLQAIAATRILMDRSEVERVLVVCPASLKHQWASEIRKFIGEDSQIVAGGIQARIEHYRKRALITIVNYEQVLRDTQPISALDPDLLILDEAQRIKNWRAKTAEAIKSIRTRFAFVLSGTPLQNRLDDLYSILQVVDRRVLGPLWAFNERFIEREPGGSRIQNYKNLGELRRRLQPVVLRREKAEVKLQLPERLDSRLGVELTPRQREFMDEGLATAARYAALAKKRPLRPEEQQRLFMAMQNARMACNAAGLIDKETKGSPKLEEFSELIQELCLQGERKVVVFSEWEKFGRMAAQCAERLGISFERLHGGVPTAKRAELISRFRDDPKCRLFFSTDAGGVGLNLQFASVLINLELPWNPAVLEQRIGRLHRHGQTQPVNVLLLVSENSFESSLERVLAGKRALFGAALSAGSEVDAIDAPSGCLSVVREALFDLDSDGEGGQEPILEGEGPTELPPETDAAPAPPSDQDPSGKLSSLLGPRLFRVLATPSGRLVAVVDRLDETTRTAAEQVGAVVTEQAALESLNSLGDESPLAHSRVLFDRKAETEACSTRADYRAEQVLVSSRKLVADQKLASADLPAEAIGQAAAAMTAGLRALLSFGESGLDLPPARLMYEVLVPQGRLTLEQAAQVSKAESLARVYADSAVPVPAELVRSVLADADGILASLLA